MILCQEMEQYRKVRRSLTKPRREMARMVISIFCKTITLLMILQFVCNMLLLENKNASSEGKVQVILRITKMSLNCSDEIHDIHVQKLLQLAPLNNYTLIENYLMINVDKIEDEYNVVTSALYYVIKWDLPISQLQTLLQSTCGDLAICVNGYTLLQTMVLCNKTKDYIETAVEAGINTFGFSTFADNQVLAIACTQLWKMKNNCTNRRQNCLDIIDYLLSIETEPSIIDMTYLAFTFFGNQELLFGHDLKIRLESLQENSEIFRELTRKMETDANGTIIKGSRHTVCSLLKLNVREVAKILLNEKLKDHLNSKLSNLEIFGCLFTSHFEEARRLAVKIETALSNLTKIRLNYDCAFQVFEYLLEDDLDNLNAAI